MRFINTSKYLALLIGCVIFFAAVADAHADFYPHPVFVAIPILAIALDTGITYANANALSNDDPNIVTGVAGLTLGSLIMISGVIALPQVEEPWEFGISLGIGALGVTSVVYGWRVIRSSWHKENLTQDGRNMRLTPVLSLGDRSERQAGLIVQVSF